MFQHHIGQYIHKNFCFRICLKIKLFLELIFLIYLIYDKRNIITEECVCKYYEFLVNRIDFIKIKRNKLVHENKSEITITDRNMIKLVSDYLVFFLIYHFKNVKQILEIKLFWII